MWSAQLEAACAYFGGGSLFRNYIHDVGSGICMMGTGSTVSVLIENNYEHRLFHYNDAHHEAATVRDFKENGDNTRTIRWVGNFLDSDSLFVSGGLFIQPTFEPFHNMWLEGNVFAGEGFNLWMTDSDCCTYSNVHATNNRFKAGTRDWYGPSHTEGPGWDTWSDNALYDGTRPDARGAVVIP